MQQKQLTVREAACIITGYGIGGTFWQILIIIAYILMAAGSVV